MVIFETAQINFTENLSFENVVWGTFVALVIFF